MTIIEFSVGHRFHEQEPDLPANSRFAPNPRLFIRTPSTTELRTAIQVLKTLGERIREHAAHSVLQLPYTRLGAQYAVRTEVRAIAQTTRIETVVAPLQDWCNELLTNGE